MTGATHTCGCGCEEQRAGTKGTYLERVLTDGATELLAFGLCHIFLQAMLTERVVAGQTARHRQKRQADGALEFLEGSKKKAPMRERP